MPRSSISISSNAEAIAKRVTTWSEHVSPALARATLEAATFITAQAKREAPVDTGRLRRSIHYQAGGVGRYVVMPNTPYAVPVHEGRRTRRGRTRPNPYMTRAREKSRSRIEQIARAAGASIVTRQG